MTLYRKLNSASGIRLLIINPRSALSETICASMHETSLDFSPKYTALSYSWATEDGDASAKRSIEIDGQLVNVTANLHQALSRLSLKSHPLQIWADALCINQNDNDEKGRQVRMMGRIYKQANSVAAWLGSGRSEHEDETAFTAMQCIIEDKKIAPIWSPQKQQLRLNHTWLPPPRTAMGVPENCQICAEWDATHRPSPDGYGGISPQIHELLRAFMTLMRRRYFKRRWIVQELNIPEQTSISFYWGSHYLSYADFVSGQDIPFRGVPMDTFQLRDILFGCRGVSSLIDLVGRVNNAACGEPRDRVYALLSLAKDHRLEADYNLSVAQAYTSMGEEIIREGRVKNLFQTCSGVQPKHAEPLRDLPTWVPDFRNHFQLHSADAAWRESGGVNRCQAVISRPGVLSITLYTVGTLGDVTSDSNDYHAAVHDLTTRQQLGSVKIAKGRTKPENADELCSLDMPERYSATDGIRAGVSGFVLRRAKLIDGSQGWRIVNPFWFGYQNPDHLPYELRRYDIG